MRRRTGSAGAALDAAVPVPLHGAASQHPVRQRYLTITAAEGDEVVPRAAFHRHVSVEGHAVGHGQRGVAGGAEPHAAAHDGGGVVRHHRVVEGPQLGRLADVNAAAVVPGLVVGNIAALQDDIVGVDVDTAAAPAGVVFGDDASGHSEFAPCTESPLSFTSLRRSPAGARHTDTAAESAVRLIVLDGAAGHGKLRVADHINTAALAGKIPLDHRVAGQSHHRVWLVLIPAAEEDASALTYSAAEILVVPDHAAGHLKPSAGGNRYGSFHPGTPGHLEVFNDTAGHPEGGIRLHPHRAAVIGGDRAAAEHRVLQNQRSAVDDPGDISPGSGLGGPTFEGQAVVLAGAGQGQMPFHPEHLVRGGGQGVGLAVVHQGDDLVFRDGDGLADGVVAIDDDFHFLAVDRRVNGILKLPGGGCARVDVGDAARIHQPLSIGDVLFQALRCAVYGDHANVARAERGWINRFQTGSQHNVDGVLRRRAFKHGCRQTFHPISDDNFCEDTGPSKCCLTDFCYRIWDDQLTLNKSRIKGVCTNFLQSFR